MINPYTGSESDLNDLNTAIDEMIGAGEKANSEWRDLWIDGLNYCFGNQLEGTRQRPGWERMQVNYIYPALCQQMALLAAREPVVNVSPQSPEDEPFMEFWRGLLRWQFAHDLDMEMTCLATSLDAATYGVYVARVSWEPKAEWDSERKRWTGRPRIVLLRPECFGADPDCESLDDARYVYSRRRIAVGQALARWPEHEGMILEAAKTEGEGAGPAAPHGFGSGAAASLPEREGDLSKSGGRDVEGRLAYLLRRVRGYDYPPTMGVGGKVGDDDVPSHVTVTEIYFRDTTEKPGEEREAWPPEELLAAGHIVEDGPAFRVANPEMFPGTVPGDLVPTDAWPLRPVRQWSDEPLFPHGRRVLRIGKTILNPDPDEQRYEFSRWPFVVGVSQLLPHMWQGMNGVEMGRGLQDWVNVSAAHLCNYIKFFGDPIIRVEEGAMAGDPENRKVAEKIKAVAGAIWRHSKGGINRLQREPPVPMPEGVMAAWDRFARELQDQVGMQPVARGRQATGNPTATEIAELSRSSRVRTSMAAKLLDGWIKRVMSLVAELDQAYLDVGDTVRIVGEGQRQASEAVAEGATSARFDVEIGVGTALPYDQEAQQAKLLQLHAAVGPAILPELLDAFSDVVKDRKAVLARIEQWQAFEQFQAMQAAAAGPAGAPPA